MEVKKMKRRKNEKNRSWGSRSRIYENPYMSTFFYRPIH
jgi:hypothetical protein